MEFCETISPAEYNELRCSVGWRTINPIQAEAGIKGSKYLVVVRENNKAVAMARVISDGGYVHYLADVIVHPDYQKRGIGKEMITRLIEQVKNNLEEGYCVYFTLLAAQGKEEFYEKFGFIKRPAEGLGHGMEQWIIK